MLGSPAAYFELELSGLPELQRIERPLAECACVLTLSSNRSDNGHGCCLPPWLRVVLYLLHVFLFH